MLQELHSPLTPASGYAAGGTPLTGVSRWTTPGGDPMHQRASPGLSVAGTPGAAGQLLPQAGASPYAALSDAPTPAWDGPGSALRTPLTGHGTPPPLDFGGGLATGEGWQGGSPFSPHLADAPTPGALGLGGGYVIKRFRWGSGGGGALQAATCAAVPLWVTAAAQLPRSLLQLPANQLRAAAAAPPPPGPLPLLPPAAMVPTTWRRGRSRPAATPRRWRHRRRRCRGLWSCR